MVIKVKKSQTKIQISIVLMLMIFVGCLILTISSNVGAQTSFPLPDSVDSYGYNTTTQTMTDTNGLTYKTEANGVISVNNERFLAFALKGKVGETEHIYTSMDFEWTWHTNKTDNDYVFWAENNNPNFIWKQYYYFYEDPLKPMKIEHYLENNWNDITDIQMYYLMTISDSDVIERNNTEYIVGDIKPFHATGDFNDEVSTINFNDMFDFDFKDIINDGFTINEFYIGSGSVINKSSIDIMAIGFTKNNGNFPKGASVLIDPTFSTDGVESIGICPLDNETIIVSWADETNDDRTFAIYDTNGTLKVGPIDADDNAGSSGSESIECAAFNSTHFVVGWHDNIDYDTSFRIYDSDGNAITGIIDADEDVGTSYSVSVSAFNSTHFVIGWWDAVDDDASFKIYDSSGNNLTGIIDADTNAGNSYSVSVSAFNSTHFVIGWHHDLLDDTLFKVYDSSGNAITGVITADDSVSISQSVSVSTFNSTHLVIGWFDRADSDASFRIYDSSGNAITGIIDADTNVGTASYLASVSALNSTHFVIGWYDDVDEDASFKVYDSSGNNLTNIIDAGATAFMWQDVSSYEAATDIGIYDNNFVTGWVHTSSLAVWGLYSGNDGSIITSSDDVAPTVSWNYPADDSFNASRTFNVGFTPADETALDNCTLRDNRSSSMADTVGNTSALTDSAVNTIAETFTADGHYNISIKCWDTSSNSAETVGRLIKVDTTAPSVSSYYQWDTNNATVDFDVWTEGFVSVNWNLTDVAGVNTSTCQIKMRNKDTATDYTNLSYVDDAHHPDYDSVTGYKDLVCYTSTFDDGTVRVTANMTRSYDWRPLVTAFDQDSAAQDNTFNNFGNRATKIALHNITNTINTTFIFMADIDNQSATVADLIFYSCNSSYTTGDFTTSPYCALVGAVSPTATRDVNFNYLIGALTTDENGTFGGVVHTETMYGMSYCPSCTNTNNAWQTFSTNGYDGHSSTSVNGGSGWTDLSGEEFNVILHVIDNTQIEFNLTIDDDLGNELTVLQSDAYGVLPNRAPFGDITTDNVTGCLASYYDIHDIIEKGTICVNVTASDPNADDMNVSIYLLNNDSTANSTLLTDYAVEGYGIVCHQWDTTTVDDGDYRLNVTAYDGSLTGYDESAGYIRIDNTIPILTITSPTNYTNTTTSINITGSVTELYLKNCTTNTTEYSTTINSNSSFTFEYQSALTEKEYHVLVSCYDEAENLGTGLVIFTYYNETYSNEIFPDNVYADEYETANITIDLNSDFSGTNQTYYTIPFDLSLVNTTSITVKNSTDGNITFARVNDLLNFTIDGTQDPYYITYDVKAIDKMTRIEYGECTTGWQQYTNYCLLMTSTESAVTYNYRYFMNVTRNETNQSHILHNQSTSIFFNFGSRNALSVNVNGSSTNTTATVLGSILQYNITDSHQNGSLYSLNEGIYYIEVIYDVSAPAIPTSPGGGSTSSEGDITTCGNGICDLDETSVNCLIDCPIPFTNDFIIPRNLNYSVIGGKINEQEFTIRNKGSEIIKLELSTVCESGFEELCTWNWFNVNEERSSNIFITLQPFENVTMTLYTLPPITIKQTAYTINIKATRLDDNINENSPLVKWIRVDHIVSISSIPDQMFEYGLDALEYEIWGDFAKPIPYTQKDNFTVSDLVIIIVGLSVFVGLMFKMKVL